MFGQTPLDMCLGINVHRVNEIFVFKYKEVKDKDLTKVTNEAMAEIIFSNIKNYSYMHSSQIIHESIIQAVRIGLPSIGDYLESRMIKSEHTFESTTHYQIEKKY